MKEFEYVYGYVWVEVLAKLIVKNWSVAVIIAGGLSEQLIVKVNYTGENEHIYPT